MKNIKLLLCTAIIGGLLQHTSAQSVSTGKPFTIKGVVTGAKVDSATLYYEGEGGKYMHQTVPVKNNQFTLTGNIPHAVSSRIIFKKTKEVIPREKQEERMREFYIEPGMMILKGDPVNVKTLIMTGSKTQTEYEALNSKIESIRLEEKPLEAKYMKANEEYMNAEKNKKSAAVLDSLKYIAADIHDQFEPYNARIKRDTYKFFTEHPNSYVTLNMMRYYVSSMSLDSAKQIYNAFNSELKATPDARDIDEHIKQIEAGSPGAIAPLFTKTDINGKALSLADFKGKYVMLDFWASWCVPCRKSNPHMIELYNKYKAKGFDVIGIADDDRKIAVWNAAVAKDGVGIWHNVLRGLDMDKIMKNIKNPEDLDQQYGIASIPTKILIGPDGKILGRYGDSYGGTEEDMDKMLASIFDK
ncbi:AhpC/TSA family protein [Mucilaginibacter corticis]|uniref:AhpC/TSA family protein n=1 Tax=Mucilaginibacter corticis TaxID=2597670 RepID=A0A556ML17_9SPHI|nr:TlpA disulfide reductase family protein [Mucilaginibacter corticis]TSJ40542.1 AhpC/TSA family protein [Mucilaginibacter corticis]